MLIIKAIRHARDLWRLAWSCEQLRLLCPPYLWNLPGTALRSGFQSSRELWNPLSEAVISKCSFMWNKGRAVIWNYHKSQKWIVRRTCKYISQFVALNTAFVEFWYNQPQFTQIIYNYNQQRNQQTRKRRTRFTFHKTTCPHYNDVIISAMASRINRPHDCLLNHLFKAQIMRKHHSSASLSFVSRIHRWPVNSPHKGPVTWKMFPLDDVIMHFL